VKAASGAIKGLCTKILVYIAVLLLFGSGHLIKQPEEHGCFIEAA
jgi:hypothetical protein